LDVPTPYLLFLGDAPDRLAIKTALGVVDWRRELCVGQWRLPACKTDAGLPDMTPEEARRAGAQTLVIGVVNPGGVMPDAWTEAILRAMAAGLNVASGMHKRLGAFPAFAEAARRSGAGLFDLRFSDETLSVGDGARRPGKRLLTVGTDCSVGKKYAALAIADELRRRGRKAEFRATGQTGVLLAGSGLAIDAVAADFISGAAERLSPAAPPDHWDIVEGQGSLFHPAFAGVTLGLLHGAQPDAFVVCHEPTRRTVRNNAFPVPSIAEVIEATIFNGRLTNPEIRPAGIAVNTSAMAEGAAADYLAGLRETHRLPVCDPIAGGVADIVDYLEADFGA